MTFKFASRWGVSGHGIPDPVALDFLLKNQFEIFQLYLMQLGCPEVSVMRTPEMERKPVPCACPSALPGGNGLS